jgi:hypothetical protein
MLLGSTRFAQPPPRTSEGFLERYAATCQRDSDLGQNASLDSSVWKSDKLQPPATLLPSTTVITSGPANTNYSHKHCILHGCPDSSLEATNLRLRLPFTDPIYTNSRCACNEYVALYKRHLQLQYDPHEIDLDIITEAFTYVYQDYPPTEVRKSTVEQIVNMKPKHKQRLYRAAAESLKLRPDLGTKDMNINMFVKNERMSSTDKPPRAIQGLSPRYNLLLQQYLTPIEKHFKSMGYDKQMSTKGMDLYKQANFLQHQSDRFNDPCYVLADHSRFDSRQHETWLQYECEYYMHYYPGDQNLQQLLDQQCRTHNSGITRKGTRYTLRGSRLSGVPNTSLGNSIVNYAIISYWLNSCGIRKYRIIVNGDDSVIIIEREDVHLLNSESLARLKFGTTYTVEDEFQRVSFCQTNPIRTINGQLMVRDPMRVMSRSTVCIDPSVKPQSFGDWLHTVGQCEISLNRGVPILQSFAKFLIRQGNKTLNIHDDLQYRAMAHAGSEEITSNARYDFMIAFGIGSDTQIQYEQYFDSLGKISGPTHHVFTPTDKIVEIPAETSTSIAKSTTECHIKPYQALLRGSNTEPSTQRSHTSRSNIVTRYSLCGGDTARLSAQSSQ